MQTDKEYAQALFELAKQEGQLEECRQALETVLQLLNQYPDYIPCLASPAIVLQERLHLIDEAFGGMPEYVVSFLKLLCENSRIPLLPTCIADFQELVDEENNTVCACIVSVIELTQEQKDALCGKLERQLGKKVEATYQVDTSLLGGVRIEVEGKVYDGSLQRRLQDMKDVMSR